MIYNADILSLVKGNIAKPANLTNFAQEQIANPLCGDRVRWYLPKQPSNDNCLHDLYYEVSGCLLTRAASHLCHQQFHAKATERVQQFIDKHQLHKPILEFTEELALFADLNQSPNRQQCVSLPFLGLQKLLAQIDY